MYRSIVEKVGSEFVVLPADEAHHLVRVRRAKPGTRFLGLAEGRWWICELARRQEQWIGRIVGLLDQNRESPLRVTLAQALIKKDRFEWVVQKSAELGVAEIVPLRTKRTELRVDERRLPKLMNRWRKILIETVKQCGRTQVPILHEPVDLAEFRQSRRSDLMLVLDEREGESLRSILRRRTDAQSCALFVGPEGGWDDLDRDFFSQGDFASVQLGPRILRTETAPVAILAILQYELGDLGEV